MGSVLIRPGEGPIHLTEPPIVPSAPSHISLSRILNRKSRQPTTPSHYSTLFQKDDAVGIRSLLKILNPPSV